MQEAMPAYGVMSAGARKRPFHHFKIRYPLSQEQDSLQWFGGTYAAHPQFFPREQLGANWIRNCLLPLCIAPPTRFEGFMIHNYKRQVLASDFDDQMSKRSDYKGLADLPTPLLTVEKISKVWQDKYDWFTVVPELYVPNRRSSLAHDSAMFASAFVDPVQHNEKELPAAPLHNVRKPGAPATIALANKAYVAALHGAKDHKKLHRGGILWDPADDSLPLLDFFVLEAVRKTQRFPALVSNPFSEEQETECALAYQIRDVWDDLSSAARSELNELKDLKEPAIDYWWRRYTRSFQDQTSPETYLRKCIGTDPEFQALERRIDLLACRQSRVVLQEEQYVSVTNTPQFPNETELAEYAKENDLPCERALLTILSCLARMDEKKMPTWWIPGEEKRRDMLPLSQLHYALTQQLFLDAKTFFLEWLERDRADYLDWLERASANESDANNASDWHSASDIVS